MFQRTLAGNEKALGPEHVSTLGTIQNLGLLYYKQGNLREAEAMYQRLLEAQSQLCQPPGLSILVRNSKV